MLLLGYPLRRWFTPQGCRGAGSFTAGIVSCCAPPPRDCLVLKTWVELWMSAGKREVVIAACSSLEPHQNNASLYCSSPNKRGSGAVDLIAVNERSSLRCRHVCERSRTKRYNGAEYSDCTCATTTTEEACRRSMYAGRLTGGAVLIVFDVFAGVILEHRSGLVWSTD